MALWLLFHPYEPQYIPGTRIQIPFTPGIFPRGRHKLSISIADTITDILLTKEDIKKQAEKLITEDNIFKTFDALFDSVGAELRDISHIRRMYRYVGNLLPPLLQKLLSDYILTLEQGDVKHFDSLFNQLFNRVLPRLSITESQAGFISQIIFKNIITAFHVRRILIDVLTPDNIDVLEETVRTRVGGVQGFIMRFVDIKKGFYQFRQFLVDEPDESEQLIGQMMGKLNLQEQLALEIRKFSPQHLPLETLEDIRIQLLEASRKLLIVNREDIVLALCNISEEATHSITTSLMHIDYSKVGEEWLPGFKRDLAHFSYTYLNKELENMLSKALPAISLNTVIVEKIDQFSAQQLEETIQRICHRELRWLAFLGAFLGFWLGLVSNFVAYWWHPVGP